MRQGKVPFLSLAALPYSGLGVGVGVDETWGEPESSVKGKSKRWLQDAGD
jgi:hypothetical protein